MLFSPKKYPPPPPNNKKNLILFSKILPLNVGDRSELAPFTLFKIYDVKPWCHLLAENKVKVVTKISAQRSSKQGGEGGRGGRGNPPSRGAQVGFEQINQSRRREDVLSASKYSPPVTCCAIPFLPYYWTQAQQRDPALSPIEDVSPSLEMEAEQDSMNRLQVGSMIHQKSTSFNSMTSETKGA